MYGPVLICCEGKTEKEYLDILKHRIFRIPSYVKVVSLGFLRTSKCKLRGRRDSTKRLSIESWSLGLILQKRKASSKIKLSAGRFAMMMVCVARILI